MADDGKIGGFFNFIGKAQKNLFGDELDAAWWKEQQEGATNYLGALKALDVESSNLSREFILGRSRVNEFKGVITDTAPLVRRLGGDIGEITKMVEDTGAALKRTVIFSPEVYAKMYATTTLLGESFATIAENFSNVGISVAKVGGEVEKSISYVNMYFN